MAKRRQSHEDRIVCDPNIMVGKPMVKGTRIPVELILQHLEENPDIADLLAAFPRLTVEDVKACLANARTLIGAERCGVSRGSLALAAGE